MTRPVIGLPLDHETGGGYSAMPWYALRQNYCDIVADAGGVPLLLPHLPDLIGRYLGMIDGVLIPGGNFDIDPALFGASVRHETVTVKADRTAFELDLTRAALRQDKPVLGICGGQQLLAVALGGTLIQHIPAEFETPIAHEQPNPRTEPGHTVRVLPDTLLHRIAGADEFPVNSAHHQAVRDPGEGASVNAVAPDGVIEGIEAGRYRFCLGVQWHPEYRISPVDQKIVDAFVQASA